MLWYLHLELALHKIKMGGKIQADGFKPQCYKEDKIFWALSGACEGAPVGTRMPVDQMRAPSGPRWRPVASEVFALGCSWARPPARWAAGLRPGAGPKHCALPGGEAGEAEPDISSSHGPAALTLGR